MLPLHLIFFSQMFSSEETTYDNFGPEKQSNGPYKPLKVPRYSMEFIIMYLPGLGYVLLKNKNKGPDIKVIYF